MLFGVNTVAEAPAAAALLAGGVVPACAGATPWVAPQYPP
jgi:hypothetical protein